MAMTTHLRTPDPPDSRKAGYAAHSVFAVKAAFAPHCRFIPIP